MSSQVRDRAAEPEEICRNASTRTFAVFGIEEGPEQRTTGERIGKVNLGQ